MYTASSDAEQEQHLWELDDMLWDPFSLVAERTPQPLAQPGGGAARAETGTAAVLQPALGAGRATPRGGGCKKPGGCLVPGCTTSRELTRYERRAMLCALHLKAASVTVGGAPHRFCQKCRRLEPLPLFDGSRRSCRAQLQAVKAKRAREKEVENWPEGAAHSPLAPPAPPPPPPAGQPARRATALAASRAWAQPRRVVDGQAVGALCVVPTAAPGAPHPYSPGQSATKQPVVHPAPAPPSPTSPAWVLPLPECLTVDLKLEAPPQVALPAAAAATATPAPGGSSRQHLLSALLLDEWSPPLLGGRDETGGIQVFGAIRPGCTLLTLDACLDGSAGVPRLLRPESSLLAADPPRWVAAMSGAGPGRAAPPAGRPRAQPCRQRRAAVWRALHRGGAVHLPQRGGGVTLRSKLWWVNSSRAVDGARQRAVPAWRGCHSSGGGACHTAGVAAQRRGWLRVPGLV